MQPVAIVTLIGTALTVVVLAVYLIAVAGILRRVNAQLRTVVAGLWSIGDQTEQLGSTMTQINRNLDDARDALQRALYQEGSGERRTPAR